MTQEPISERPADGVIGTAARLTAGTSLIRGISASTQFLLVFWIMPEEFGYWAAANASIAILAGFANLGMVNAYLSRDGISRPGLLRDTLYANLGLAAVGACISGLYLAGGRPEVALLALIASLTIPVSGAADAHHAFRVEARNVRRVLLSQASAAGAKLIVGVAVAIATQSALALALANATFWLLTLALLYSLTDRSGREAATALPVRSRAKWVANKWALSMQVHAVILVAQFFASPTALGLFYLGYQLIIAVQSLIAAPLHRVAIASLASVPAPERRALAVRVVTPVGAVGLIGAAVLTLGLLGARPGLPAAWADAVPVAIVLAALLPTRLVAPIVDGDLLTSGRWGTSTAIYLVDGLGCALLALVLIEHGPTWLAVGVFGWKTAVAVTRMVMLLGVARAGLTNVALLTVLALALVVATLLSTAVQLAAASTAMALGCFSLIHSVRTHRASKAKG